MPFLGILVFVAVGVALIMHPGLFSGVPDKTVRGIGKIFVVFASLGFVVALGFAWAGHSHLRAAVASGSTKVVEGLVTDYLAPKKGVETYFVNGVEFTYSDFGPASGFTNTHAYGGPIQPGLQVRITYVDNDPFANNELGRSIVKLEVRE